MKKIIREVHEVRSVADMNDAFNEDWAHRSRRL